MEHHSFNVDKLDLSFSHGLRALPFKSSFKQKMKIVAKCLSEFLTRTEPRGLGLVKRGAKEFSVHVSLCGNDKIKSLNRDYRGKDKVTDVLSFPMNEDLRGEKEPLFAMCELGDIIICSPVMQKQAVEFSISNEEEFFHLVVHGFLHLCGYDHEISEEEEKIMEKLEKQLISNISKGLK
jgi:probable rRNA maturation factor